MRRRRGDERGAALVEAALVVPLVILLTFGVIEIGFAFNEQGTLRAQTRAAARAASTLPKAEHDDVVEAALNAMDAGMRNLTSGEPQYVLVFESVAGTPDPDSEAACLGRDNCTVHAWDPESERFARGGSGDVWMDEEREACDATDKIGVFVRVTHPFITGLPLSRNPDGSLDSEISLSAATVMALEPYPPPGCHATAAS